MFVHTLSPMKGKEAIHDTQNMTMKKVRTWHVCTVNGGKNASPERFEHSRAKHNRLSATEIAGDPVNHSGKATIHSLENVRI
jgi:hypothetical protein